MKKMTTANLKQDKTFIFQNFKTGEQKVIVAFNLQEAFNQLTFHVAEPADYQIIGEQE